MKPTTLLVPSAHLSFCPRTKGCGGRARVNSRATLNHLHLRRSRDESQRQQQSVVVKCRVAWPSLLVERSENGRFVGGLRLDRSRGRSCGVGCRALGIEADVPLSSYCSFGIGGPAKYLARAKSVEDFRSAARFAQEHQLPVLVVGKGSNCLFDDRGYQGLVIVNELSFVEPFPIEKPNRRRMEKREKDGGAETLKASKDALSSGAEGHPSRQLQARREEEEKLVLKVGSGYPFNTLGQLLSSAGWGGLEFATGIPGSVGGAIYMNAGANGMETVSSLVKVEYITREGELRVLDPVKVAEFAYRKSPFQSMRDLLAIVSGTFELKSCSFARGRAREYMQKRNKSQPLKEKSAGCIFRNPVTAATFASSSGSNTDEADAAVRPMSEDLSELSAGALIDRAGLKGASCGSAQVSPMHANYLICTERTEQSSKDMKDLITLVKEKIKCETGISLQEEIKIIPYEPIPY